MVTLTQCTTGPTICPPSVGCHHGGPIGQTGWYTCGLLGPTAYQGCTSLLGCNTATTPPQGAEAENVTLTGVVGCISYPPMCAPERTIGQTGWHTCGIIGPTGTQNCTHLMGCTTVTAPPQGAAGAQTVLPPTVDCILPPTIKCITVTTTVATTAPGAQAQGVVGPTGTLGCTAIGCPVTITCQPTNTIAGHTHALGCNTATTPPQTIGQTGWYTCGHVGPTGTLGCTALGCPVTVTCQPTNTIAGHTHLCDAAAQGVVGPTGTQGCTQMLGCTTVGTPPTDYGCTTVTATPTNTIAGHTHLMGCTTITAAPQGATLPPPTSTMPPVCQLTGVQGCITYPPMCGPVTNTIAGNTHVCGAQAQTAVTTTVAATALLGCFPTKGCHPHTGIPFVC